MWTRVASVLIATGLATLLYIGGTHLFIDSFESRGAAIAWSLTLLLMPVVIAVPFWFPFHGIRWVGLLVAVAMTSQAFTLMWLHLLWFDSSRSEVARLFQQQVILDLVLWFLIMVPFASVVSVARLVRDTPAPRGVLPSEDTKYYPLTRI